MYGEHVQQRMHQPGMVTNLACGQLNRKNVFFPVHVRARRFRPSGPASTRLFSPLRVIRCLLFNGLPPAFRGGVHVYRQPPPGQTRFYRFVQLRADGAHCRESAGTGPVVLKGVPVTGDSF